MSVDNQNVWVYAGDDALLTISVVDENSAPLPLAGASLTWVLSKQAGSGALVTKTLGSGITVTDQAGGVLQVAISHADTAPLQGGLWHQLVMTDATGNVSTLTTGTFTVKRRT